MSDSKPTFITHLAALVRSTYNDDVTDGYADLVRGIAMDIKAAHEKELARVQAKRKAGEA